MLLQDKLEQYQTPSHYGAHKTDLTWKTTCLYLQDIFTSFGCPRRWGQSEKIGQKITYCYHAWQCKTKSTFPQDPDLDHILARIWSSQESPPNLEGQFWIQRPCTSRKDLYKKTVLLIFTPKKLLFFSKSILLEFTFYFGQIKMKSGSAYGPGLFEMSDPDPDQIALKSQLRSNKKKFTLLSENYSFLFQRQKSLSANCCDTKNLSIFICSPTSVASLFAY